MGHYAFLDSDNIVTEVINGKDEDEGGVNWEEWYANFRGQVCKRTSYNTRGNVHLYGGIPYRKNYAGVGFTYDESRDAFIPPQPYPSWILNENTCLWEPPVSPPENTVPHVWSESILNWIPAQ